MGTILAGLPHELLEGSILQLGFCLVDTARARLD